MKNPDQFKTFTMLRVFMVTYRNQTKTYLGYREGHFYRWEQRRKNDGSRKEPERLTRRETSLYLAMELAISPDEAWHLIDKFIQTGSSEGCS
jgi:hypothetical protein